MANGITGSGIWGDVSGLAEGLSTLRFQGDGAIYGVTQQMERPMQTRNKLFDDIGQLMTNAMGVAQGARDEAETAMKGMMDRWLADRDFVTREEFDAVRGMAQKAREENEALKARIEALEAKG
jgi:BMFP domain-containing protein YqiC